MKTRLLITGARGQLGTALLRLTADRDDLECMATDVAELDITSEQAVEDAVARIKPQYIVNCAAYTAVDRAESDEECALLINAGAPTILARAARTHNARLLHISTDYVFAGDAHRPQLEEDAPAPRTAYGRTKLAGERAVLQTLPEQSVILRTAWLYSPFGSNFVKTMLRLASERDEIRVVDDQIGTPTSAFTLARAILAVIDAEQWQPGIYHLTDSGVASWYDLAHEALTLAGCTTCKVTPVSSEQYASPTPRPFYSVLSKHKFTATFGLELPHWRDSLAECISQLSND